MWLAFNGIKTDPACTLTTGVLAIHAHPLVLLPKRVLLVVRMSLWTMSGAGMLRCK
jgi:hypothetical protein